MNEFDESAPGETEREKSEKSRNFVKEIIGIYTSDPNRTPARALSVLE